MFTPRLIRAVLAFPEKQRSAFTQLVGLRNLKRITGASLGVIIVQKQENKHKAADELHNLGERDELLPRRRVVASKNKKMTGLVMFLFAMIYLIE